MYDHMHIYISHRGISVDHGINADHGINVDQHPKPRIM
jgi:hypothetical protein